MCSRCTNELRIWDNRHDECLLQAPLPSKEVTVSILVLVFRALLYEFQPGTAYFAAQGRFFRMLASVADMDLANTLMQLDIAFEMSSKEIPTGARQLAGYVINTLSRYEEKLLFAFASGNMQVLSAVVRSMQSARRDHEVKRQRVDNLMQCSICLEQITECSITDCGHVFCSGCIERSLEATPSCPVCRGTVESLSSKNN
jgi:hypothetical protein